MIRVPMSADQTKDVFFRLTRDQGKKRIPLSLRLDVPGIGEVGCAELLRVVPSRRITCIGSAGNRPLIVKFFFARHDARRHWKRSDRGCGYFLEKHIPAPAILYSGYLSGLRVYVMVFEYLEGAVGLRDCMEKARDASARAGLLGALMAVIARQHEAGIMQHDLHLGNFMVMDGVVYSLDGDHVTSLHRPAGRSESFRNLAYLFAQEIFLVGNRIDELAGAYGKQRGWVVSESDLEEIKGYLREARNRMFLKYLWKAARKKPCFLSYSYREGMAVLPDAGPDEVGMLTQVLDCPDRRPYGGCTGGFRLVPASQGRVPVRECPAYGPALLRWFWKAYRVWRSMILLKMLGLETAVPVCITGEKKGFWKWDCSIVFQPVAGPTIRELFLSDSYPESQRVRAAEVLSDALCSLRDSGVTFSGIHPGRIAADGERVVFLQADAVQRYKGDRFSRVLEGFLRQLDDLPSGKTMFREQFEKKGLM
jgi:hypothetical protein